MAPKNKELEKVEKKYEEFAKLKKKGADPCDLAKKAEDYFRAPIKVLLLDEGDLKLKRKFEDLIEELTDACESQ